MGIQAGLKGKNLEGKSEVKRAKSTLRTLRGTFMVAGIFILLVAPVHSGFMAVFAVPFFAVWFAMSAFIIATDPARRRIRSIKIGIWLAVFAVVASLHAWYAYSTRQYAEDVIAKVENFEAEHLRCPASSEEIGITRAEMTKNLGYSGYYCEEDGKPHLFYAATYVVFDTYQYDFTAKRWNHRRG